MPFEDAQATPLLARIPEPERAASWHLVDPDGTRHSAGRGALALFARLPPLRPFRVLGLDRLAAAAYPLVARRRGGLGTFVPRRPGPRRFP